MSISSERLEKALKFLAETDEDAANLKVDVERASFKLKKVKAAIFVHSGGNIEERKSQAEISPEADNATVEYLDAYAKSEALQNKRKTEVLIVDVWRSLNSARTKGIIV
jgi:hypothetical protein